MWGSLLTCDLPERAQQITVLHRAFYVLHLTHVLKNFA
nr:MAG TPA: hypothetical protein [Caudoviricetes sp.]